MTLVGVQPPCVKPWARRLGTDCEGHREMIVRHARVIICEKNLVRHCYGVETTWALRMTFRHLKWDLFDSGLADPKRH